MEQANEYLEGPGLHRARRLLERNGLPASLDEDVTQEAYIALLRAERADALPDNVEAYLNQTMHNVVISMFRGELRRADGALASRRAEIEPGDVDVPETGADELDLGRLPLAGVRRSVGGELSTHAHAAAGALAVLAAADPTDPAEPADDCPRPKRGAAPHESIAWVGLFYAGLHDCWSERDDAATRARRSRCLRRQRALLEEALAGVDTREGSDHA